MRVTPWKMADSGQVETAAVVAAIRASLARLTGGPRLTAVMARSVLKNWVEVPKTGVLIAKAPGGRVHGVLVMRKEPDPDAVRVVYICGQPPRSGAGAALLAELVTVSRKRGMKEIRARCNPDDPSHLGFFLDQGNFAAVGPPVQGSSMLELEVRRVLMEEPSETS
jgi:L-amino acid N-acyltransferase YncA